MARFHTQLRLLPAALARAAASMLLGFGIASHSLAQDVGSVQSPLATNGTIWDSPSIPVCWEASKPGGSWRNTEAGRAGIGWTRDAVRTTWEAVSNVQFTGWGQCNSSSPGIRILVDNDGPHVKKLGNDLDGMSNGMVLNFDFDDWSPTCANSYAEREACIRAIAVHEFGHALGFSHEHNRSDRSVCSKEPQGTNPTILITEYDPDSIMNYCAAIWNNNGRLSPLDVYGARMMYGPFTAETPMRIQAQGTIFAKDDETIGSETGSQDYEFEISLTEALPRRVYRRELCVGGEVRVVVEVDAAIGPAAGEATLNTKSVLYEGRSCSTTDREDSDQTVVALQVGDASQPTRHRLTNGGAGGGDYAEVSFTFSRLVSETDMGASCPTCSDASIASSYAVTAPASDSPSAVEMVFLRNLGVDKCLAPGAAQSASKAYMAQTRTCRFSTSSGSGNAQKWVLEPIGQKRFRVRQTGLENHCLSLRTSRENREGGLVEVVGCSSHSDQQWQVSESAPETMTLRHASADKCLNVHGGRENRENGQVSVYSCANTPDQRWMKITEDAANILRLANPGVTPLTDRLKDSRRLPASKFPEKRQ